MKIIFLASLLSLGFAARAVPAPPPARPSRIVLITIDTWRWDAIGISGQGKVRTPVLDRLASEGIYTSRAWTSAALTAPSHASIFTGLHPDRHSVRDNNGRPLPGNFETLATVFKSHGFATAAFVSGYPVSRPYGFARGFDRFDDRLDAPDRASFGERSRRGDATVAAALAWLAKPPSHYFLWLHLYDPHAPYSPPKPFSGEPGSSPYYGEAAFVDSLVSQLIQVLSEGNSSKSAAPLIVICGDHGESLGEHGEATHGLTIYDSAARVPLILHSPGLIAARRLDGAQLVDVFPTILDLCGFPPPPKLDGQSLLRASASSTTAYIESYYPSTNFGAAPLRGASDGRWKFIDVPRPELYDLKADAGETHNLFGTTDAEEPRRLARFLRDRRKAEPPSPAVRSSEAQRKILRSLGYLGSAGELKVGSPGMDPKDFLVSYGQFEKARAAMSAGRLDEALSLYVPLLSVFPASPLLQTEIGMAHGMAGRFEKALPLLENAVGLDPSNSQGYLALGNVSQARGDLAAAEKNYRVVLKLDPSDPEALLNLGILLAGAPGRAGEAAPLLRRFLEEVPSDSEAPKLRQLLDSIGEPPKGGHR